MTDEPIDIHGPVALWDKDEEELRLAILTSVSFAQSVGELPMRDGGLPLGSVAIWIGRKDDPEAFATFYVREGNSIWLDILFVYRGHRSKGLGLLLLQTVEQIALAKGYKDIQLGTGPLNLPMHRLALKAGWGKRMLVMERKL